MPVGGEPAAGLPKHVRSWRWGGVSSRAGGIGALGLEEYAQSEQLIAYVQGTLCRKRPSASPLRYSKTRDTQSGK